MSDESNHLWQSDIRLIQNEIRSTMKNFDESPYLKRPNEALQNRLSMFSSLNLRRLETGTDNEGKIQGYFVEPRYSQGHLPKIS